MTVSSATPKGRGSSYSEGLSVETGLCAVTKSASFPHQLDRKKIKMPRDFRASENTRNAKARRAAALQRVELGFPTVPRVPAAGATSYAVKAEDPETARLIREFEERRAK